MTCYDVIDCFSEDIDLSYNITGEHLSEGKKRMLKQTILNTMEELNFPIRYLDETRSRRDYNCYHAEYSSIYTPFSLVENKIIIETYIALLPFPTVSRPVDNYIHKFLILTNQENLAGKFDLVPFDIITQDISRTLIDKVFALCDYYLTGKVQKHSHHL